MKRMLKFLSVIMLCTVVIISLVIPASANSAQTHWHGTTASGAIVTDEDCPLEVKNEILTFHIPTFPELFNDSGEEYNTTVTAKYTFYNPADYSVDATLVFPFGEYPVYVQWNTDVSGEYVRSDDTAMYDITINGEAVEKTLRHTLSVGEFNTESDLKKLRDAYVTDSFYQPETMVTEYHFQINGIEEGEDTAYISMPLDIEPSKTRVLMSPNSGFNSDKEIQIGTWAKNGEAIIIYAIGEPLAELPKWTVYENASEKKAITGDAQYIPDKEQSYSFSELAMSYFDKSGTVSEVDWYNAQVDNLNQNAIGDFGFLGDISCMDIGNSLMRWYQYNITVNSKSEIINEVVAPLYPSVRTDYEPPIYDYSYLLSPAQTWAAFGTLEIAVNTPFYMTENSQENKFTKTDSGYMISLASLPQGELSFTLSLGDAPKKIVNYSYLIYFLPYLIIAVVIVILIFVVVTIAKRRKRSNP